MKMSIITKALLLAGAILFLGGIGWKAWPLLDAAERCVAIGLTVVIAGWLHWLRDPVE